MWRQLLQRVLCSSLMSTMVDKVVTATGRPPPMVQEEDQVRQQPTKPGEGVQLSHSDDISIVITSGKDTSKFTVLMAFITSMHITVNLIAIVIVGIWVWACVRTGGFIHWGTDDVILLGSLFGSKALQTKVNNDNSAYRSTSGSSSSRYQPQQDGSSVSTDEHGDTIVKIPSPTTKPRTKYSSGA